MRRTAIVIGVIVVLAALVAGAVIYFNPGAENQPDKVILRVHWINGVNFSGFYAAQDQGYYRANNLEVSIEPAPTGATSLQLVAAGSAQFGVIGGADEVINAQAKGLPVIALGAILQKNTVVFISKKGSGIKRPQDFVGHKVGTWPGRTVGLMLDAMLKKEGIDKRQIDITPAQVDMTPFFTGQFDVWPGLAFWEPVIAREKNVEVNIISPGDYGIPLYGYILFTNRKFLKEHSGLVKRFVTATFKGWQWALDHPEKAVEYAAKRNKQLNKDLGMKMFLVMKKYIVSADTRAHGLGWIDAKKWQDTVQTLEELGIIKSNATSGAPFTNRFISKN